MGKPHKKGLSKLPKKFKCNYCTKLYRMNWALVNHEKVCPFKFSK